MVATRGGGNEEMLAKKYKLSARRWVSSEDLMHSIVTIDRNTVFIYLEVAWRVDLRCSDHKKRTGNYMTDRGVS